MCVCVCASTSICLALCFSISLSVLPVSVYLSICMSIYLSICTYLSYLTSFSSLSINPSFFPCVSVIGTYLRTNATRSRTKQALDPHKPRAHTPDATSPCSRS